MVVSALNSADETLALPMSVGCYVRKPPLILIVIYSGWMLSANWRDKVMWLAAVAIFAHGF